jgi:branched-chain amino acid transport system substrate-binding protein
MRVGEMKVGLRILATVISVATAAPAVAAEKIKIGYLTSLSGPGAIVGTELMNGFNLALEHLDNKIGGLPAEMFVGDDQQKPDVARQIVQKFIETNKVDVIAGVPWSNVMMAVYQPIIKSGTILVGSNAGPSPIAGEQCSNRFFSTSWQSDNVAEAMGAHLQKLGLQNVYLLAPNYQAGKDLLAGFKRFYKGSIAGEVYTGLTQLDFAAELAQLRATKPSAVFAFYPGGLGIQFLKQYSQAGLSNSIPLYTVYSVDAVTLPAVGEAALGVATTTFWNVTLDNPTNKRFVGDYRAKYGKDPSEYAAQAYDTAMLLDSGVRQVNGKIEDREALAAALAKADFSSLRGKFKFNNNHFPIQDFYYATVVRGRGGKLEIQLGDVVFRDHADAYGDKCALK